MIITVKWLMVLAVSLTVVVSCGASTSSRVSPPSLQGVWTTTTNNNYQTVVLEVQHEGDKIVAASSTVSYECLDFTSVGGKDYPDVHQKQSKADIEINGSDIHIGLWMFPIDSDGTVHDASYYAFDGQLTSTTTLELKTSDSGTIQTYVFHATNTPATNIIANAARSYNNAACTPTSAPTPILSPTPTPRPTPLPITFTGSGADSTTTFITNVTWNLVSVCTTSTEGAPYTITIHVMQPEQVAAQQIGQDINFVCNGQTNTDQSNPSGFPPGTYYLQVATGGDWKSTVKKG